MFNKKMETIPKNKIKEIQLKKLKETVHKASNINFYKKKFKELKIKPGPKVGEILNKLFEEVENKKIPNKRKELLRRLNNFK